MVNHLKASTPWYIKATAEGLTIRARVRREGKWNPLAAVIGTQLIASGGR